MPAVILTERDKERLRNAHRYYRETGEALERVEASGGVVAATYTSYYRVAHNAARESLLTTMFEHGVGDLSEVFSPKEQSEMLD